MQRTNPTTAYGQEAFAEELSIGVVAESEAWIDDQIAELFALAEEFGECVSHTESDDWMNDDEAQTTEE